MTALLTNPTLNKDPGICFNIGNASDIKEGPRLDDGADSCNASSCSDSTSGTSD